MPLKLKTNSIEIKTALLRYYRYDRQIIAVPEIKMYHSSLGICDMVALNKNGYLLDIEIKVSISDLKKDFKKMKHKWYSKEYGEHFLSPNYFYFCIPKDLINDDYIKEIEKMDYIGIMVYNKDHYPYENEIYIYKRAPLITKKKNEEYFKNLILKRLTAECFNYYEYKTRMLKNELDK